MIKNQNSKIREQGKARLWGDGGSSAVVCCSRIGTIRALLHFAEVV
jgi:hypothetical protein